MLSHLLEHPSTDPCLNLLMQERRPFGRRCMPTTKGPCKKLRWVPWAVSFHSWAIRSFGNPPLWAGPVWSGWYYWNAWIRWQKLPQYLLEVNTLSLWGQGFDPADGWQYGGWNLQKGVAEFEEFTPAYLKEKMGLTPEQFIDLKALMGDKVG